jgi:parallel beta-helix repeat protein
VAFARCRVTRALITGDEEEEGDRAGLRLVGSTTCLVQDCLTDGNNDTGILVEDQGQVTLDGNVCSNSV